jgi:hypothetical protein
MIDNAYTDWQVHYETCPRCRPNWTCEVGAEIQRRQERQEPLPLEVES